MFTQASLPTLPKVTDTSYWTELSLA